MNVVDILKPIGSLVGGICATQVAETVISTFKPNELTKTGKVAWAVGGALIGGAIGNAAGDYLCDTIDSVKEMIETIKDKKKATE